MGYEQEAFRKLMSNIWGKKSRMQEEMSKGAKGEPFIVQELSREGPQTPTQLAAAMRATTGRVSTLLSALEKKGQITREIDPNDRRIVHVSLTEAGERRARAIPARAIRDDIVAGVVLFRCAQCRVRSSNRIQSALRPRAAVCAHRSRMRRNQQRQTMQSQIALREYTETGVISYTVSN